MRYINNLVTLGYPNPLSTDTGAYGVTIATAGGGASFTITATAAGTQANDGCVNLTLTNTGVKGKSGTKTLAECWK
jgi:type IV pilus assembly protein PilE